MICYYFKILLAFPYFFAKVYVVSASIVLSGGEENGLLMPTASPAERIRGVENGVPEGH